MSTRDDIVAAARDLLLAEGVGALSMRRVAERVGVSATALYRHFEDKEALLLAALQESAATLRRYFARALQAPEPAEEGSPRRRGEGERPSNPVHRLLATGEAYLEFAFAHPREYALLFMIWDELAGIGLPRPKAGQLSEGLQFLVDRVAECQAAGLIAPEDGEDVAPLELALHAWALAHGLASLWLSGGAGEALSLEAWRALSRRALRRTWAGLLRGAAR